MAYDLLLGQIAVDVSRHPAPGSPTVNAPTAAVFGLGVSLLVGAIAKQVLKTGEKHHYQREFRPGLHKTQELPVLPDISSEEIVYGQRPEEYQRRLTPAGE